MSNTAAPDQSAPSSLRARWVALLIASAADVDMRTALAYLSTGRRMRMRRMALLRIEEALERLPELAAEVARLEPATHAPVDVEKRAIVQRGQRLIEWDRDKLAPIATEARA